MIFRIATISICIYTAFYTVKFAIAERHFLWGMSYKEHCSKKQPGMCIFSAKKFKQAVKLNPDEYYYNYMLANSLISAYEGLKDKRMLAAAAPYCRKAMKHSWDKHYPHICLARIYLKAKNYKKSIEHLDKALKIIPHNEQLKGYYNGICSISGSRGHTN